MSSFLLVTCCSPLLSGGRRQLTSVNEKMRFSTREMFLTFLDVTSW
jgi:hypothetical protein